MTEVIAALRRFVPQGLKTAWWYLSDADWRANYRSIKRRQGELCNLQSQAYRSLWPQTNGRIAAGPFQGLVYLGAHRGKYPQKLLGTYEKELWPIMEMIASREYEQIIDIGAAEGYYVCGLAARIPSASVVAFEAQAKYHPKIRELARINNVSDRVECRGLCQSDDLRNALTASRHSLVVCDVEGAESKLLDPNVIPELTHTDLLVEVHENLCPGVGDELIGRFRRTHEIDVIPSERRTLSDLPSGVRLPERLALAAMEESRGGEMVWHWVRRR